MMKNKESKPKNKEYPVRDKDKKPAKYVAINISGQPVVCQGAILDPHSEIKLQSKNEAEQWDMTPNVKVNKVTE